MTVKQRAALQTLGIIAFTVVVSVATSLILKEFTAQEIVTGLSIASVLLLIYSMYGVVLSRLEYQETLKEITKNNPTLR
jgi:uncharacterized membrane protein